MKMRELKRIAREEKIRNIYGDAANDILSVLCVDDFSDESIHKAIKNKWIHDEFARKLLLMEMDEMVMLVRRKIVKNAYDNNELTIDVLGFFSMEQYSDESINKALENKWIVMVIIKSHF